MAYVKWFIYQIVLAAAFWYGFFGNINGAINLVLFISWFRLIVSLLLISEDTRTKIAVDGKIGYPIFPQLSFMISVSYVLVLVWFGAWFTGIALAISILIMRNTFNEINILRKQNVKVMGE